MSRKPDYRVGFLDKKADQKIANIGAAWTNTDGSITISLSGGLNLHTHSDNEAIITLFSTKDSNAPTH